MYVSWRFGLSDRERSRQSLGMAYSSGRNLGARTPGSSSRWAQSIARAPLASLRRHVAILLRSQTIAMIASVLGTQMSRATAEQDLVRGRRGTRT